MTRKTTDDPAQVFGREREIGLVQEVLAGSVRHLHLQGLPGIGMTTVLTEALAQGRDLRRPPVVVRPILPMLGEAQPDHAERGRLVHAIASSWRRQVLRPEDGLAAKRGEPSVDAHWFDLWRQAIEWVIERSPGPITTVLVLEDIELTALWRDRGLAHVIRASLSDGEVDLRLITTARSASASPFQRGRDEALLPVEPPAPGASELLGGARFLQVLPLPKAAAQELVQRLVSQSASTLTPDQESWVASQLGGHPGLATACLGEGLELSPDAETDEQMHLELISRATPMLDQLYSSLTEAEQKLLLSRAGFGSFLPSATANRFSLADLATRGVLARKGEAFEFFSPLLETFVALRRPVTVGLQQLMRALQPSQRKLYLALLAHPNRVVPRRRLEEVVSRSEEAVSAKSLDVHASRLRAVLSALNRGADLLGVGPESVRDVGYRLNVPEEAIQELQEAARGFLAE